MQENKKINTFILTIDQKTVLEARKNINLREQLAILIGNSGFSQESGTVREDGLYFKKVAFI